MSFDYGSCALKMVELFPSRGNIKCAIGKIES